MKVLFAEMLHGEAPRRKAAVTTPFPILERRSEGRE